MRNYSKLQAIFFSFFSPDLYRNVGQQWRGIGLGYLFLLLAIFWIPSSIYFCKSLHNFFKFQTKEIIQQIPTVTVIKGEVSIDRPIPYAIIDPKTSEELVVFDTNKTSSELHQMTSPIVVTRDAVVVKSSNQQMQVYHQFSATNYLRFTQEDYARLASPAFKTGFCLMYYIGGVVGSFLFRTIQGLFYALIGLGLAKWYGANLSGKGLIRVAIVAMTPMIMLSTINDIFLFTLRYQSFLSFVITIVYLIIAMKANRNLETLKT